MPKSNLPFLHNPLGEDTESPPISHLHTATMSFTFHDFVVLFLLLNIILLRVERYLKPPASETEPTALPGPNSTPPSPPPSDSTTCNNNPSSFTTPNPANLPAFPLAAVQRNQLFVTGFHPEDTLRALEETRHERDRLKAELLWVRKEPAKVKDVLESRKPKEPLRFGKDAEWPWSEKENEVCPGHCAWQFGLR